MGADPYVPSDGTVLWRYMKLNSFLELLSGHLIQTRIDVLNDAAEGAYGYKHIRLNGSTDTVKAIRKARTQVAATYWFEFEEHESYGMWNVYGRTGESVAIETTVGATPRSSSTNAGSIRKSARSAACKCSTSRSKTRLWISGFRWTI